MDTQKTGQPITTWPEHIESGEKMEKGQFIELVIEDMSNEGNGIGHADDGMTVFVAGAVVGDKARVGIGNVKKNFATGKAVAILEESELRADEADLCPYIDYCGGCGYGKLKYDAQLRLKEKSVKDKLSRIGGVVFENDAAERGNMGISDEKAPADCMPTAPAKFNPIIGMENPVHYRDKATIAIYNDTVGFKEKKSNMVTDCIECRIQNRYAMLIADAFRQFIRQEKIQGIFEKMVVRTTTNEDTMVMLYTADYLAKGQDKGGRKGGKKPQKKPFDVNKLNLQELAYALDDACENTLESFWINDKLIAGKNTILDTAGALDFEISPLSFYQVNPEQMVKLYDKVVEYADLKGDETILDLYCGIGTIGLFMAEKMNRLAAEKGLKPGMVYGIESVKPAIIDANRNAVINHIVNARYVCGKAEVELPVMMGLEKGYKFNEVNELVEKEPEIKIAHADIAVLDPPRAGCDEKLLNAVVKAEPDRIVYVSCDPGTLARDVKWLGEHGYTLKEATPVDMFPHTTHVETVVCLGKKHVNPKAYVEIGVDAEEYYKIKRDKH